MQIYYMCIYIFPMINLSTMQLLMISRWIFTVEDYFIGRFWQAHYIVPWNIYGYQKVNSTYTCTCTCVFILYHWLAALYLSSVNGATGVPHPELTGASATRNPAVYQQTNHTSIHTEYLCILNYYTNTTIKANLYLRGHGNLHTYSSHIIHSVSSRGSSIYLDI